MQLRFNVFNAKLEQQREKQLIETISFYDDTDLLLRIIPDDPQRQFLLAALLTTGSNTVTNDPERAFFWYEQAAERGHLDARFRLGICYMEGKGTIKDEKKAFVNFYLAASQGHVQSQINVAYFYSQGKGAKKNLIKSFEWNEKAAQSGNPNAQYNLGICYQNGRGVTRDYSKALTYFYNAARQNVVRATTALGEYYELGIGIPKNEIEAINLYEIGARAGLPEAQWKLGYCLSTGIQIERNEEVATYWINEAAKGGLPLAQHYMNKKISFNANFIFEEVSKSRHFFVPSDLPAGPPQFGPICGIVAFVNAANYSGQLKKRLYVSDYDKRAAGRNINHKNNIVSHQLFHKINFRVEEEWRSENGEIFDKKIFLLLAEHYGIKGCEVMIKGKDEYKKTIIDTLNDNKVLIIACESEHFMPVKNQGKNIHWVFVPAYWGKHFAAVHFQMVCKWKFKEQIESMEQIPIENPHKKGSHLKNFRYSIFSMPIAKDHPREVLKSRPDLGLRVQI